MKDFRELLVWKKSHEITKALYKETMNFPKDELYGLVSQIKRASSSIPSNIAEGCGRHTDKDFANFLQFSMGSACETEYLVFLSSELGYITFAKYELFLSQLTEVKKMLTSLMNKLRLPADR